MKMLRIFAFSAVVFGSVVANAAQDPLAAAVAGIRPAAPSPLVWDATEKSYTTKSGETAGQYAFWVTNTSTTNVIIEAVNVSCGCTTPSLPPLPWTLAPNESGEIRATMDIKGKTGTVTKHMTVTSSVGQQVLTLKTTVAVDPTMHMAERTQNTAIAKADPQAIFKNKCADCHFTPVLEQTSGEGIYVSACAICHEPEKWAKAAGKPPEAHHRADFVPDLAALKFPMTRQAWKIMAANGKPGTLMASFSKRHGGPLTDAQLEELTTYLVQAFPFKAPDTTKAAEAPKTEPQKVTQ
jgi:mono/diheme cytochrome c family protein